MPIFPAGYIGGRTLGRETLVKAAQNITGFSMANPAVVTAVAHGHQTGEYVWITNGDMNELTEGWYQITRLGPDTFSIPIATQCAAIAVANVDTTNNTITAAGTNWPQRQALIYQNGGGASITGLVHGTTYYVRYDGLTPNQIAAGTFHLSATASGAIIDLTGTGNAAQYFKMTTWTAGGTITGKGLAAPENGNCTYLTMINGSVDNPSTVPLFWSAGSALPTAVPTTATPTDFLDIGQTYGAPLGCKFIAFNATATCYVRVNIVY